MIVGDCRRISSMPGCVVLAALLLSPVGASAQRDSQRKNRSLTAAIEEVRRSPFHDRDRVNHAPDGAGEQGIDPAILFVRHGGAHPVAARETGGNTQTAADRERNTSLFLWTTLGVAAGDLIVILLHDLRNLWVLAGSVPVTTLGLTLAGASSGRAFAASSLGFAAGMGVGMATLKVLEDRLNLAALVPGALAYYGVRLSVTQLIAGRGVT